LAEISPADAAQLGVRDKSNIRIVSAKGEMRAAVRISPDMRPGSVYIPYFIKESVEGFLNAHEDAVESGEDAAIPVRLEKV
ncbi:MAG TPA: molybdopterin dinucleotide binding domain-containing protein, partial [Candidatus Aminicenantes bacterium]|nr:molybdopterin dinucleotide binding domain-containing protein [Candidatus Aminicenantes bacterium]